MINKQLFRLHLALFFCFFLAVELAAQNRLLLPGEELSVFLDEHPAEKVYIHTDRDVYSVNDSVWFRIYLTNAHNNLPQSGFQSVYFELIDAAKNIKVRNLILTYNGFGKGDLDLSSYKLDGGKYQLRVYSNYQRNFGESFLFHKNIVLTNQSNNQSVEPEVGKKKKQEKEIGNQNLSSSNPVDIQFLPEGGYLSYGCPCTVAFIARDTNNQPVDVSGWIVNGTDEKIIRFSSSHNGMGKFAFIPEKDVVYKAVLDNFPGFAVQLPPATDKTRFSVRILKDTVIGLILWKPKIPSSSENYYLINRARGKISFFTKIGMSDTPAQIKLGWSKFESGVNNLTLADSLMRPLAERLIFVKKDDFFTIETNTDREEYGRREKVNVEIKTKQSNNAVPTNFSISVVNKAQDIALEQYPENILSYLLLDSELHGTVPNPSYYFKDDSISTLNKLDLVMLTYGWRNYNWNNFKDKLPDTAFKREPGLEISGKIKKLMGQKGVEDGKVSLIMKSKAGEVFISETQSDSTGVFRFPPSFFPDSVSAFLQGVNKHNRRNIEVINLSTFKPTAPVTFKSLSFPVPGDEQQSNFNRMANLRLLEDKAYNPGKYEILLDEVTVVKNKLDPMNESANDGHFRIYGMADNVLKVEDNMFAPDIWTLMSGRLSGVLVSGNSVSVRGNTPIFLLDGIPIEKDFLDGIPVSDIDKIEVLKNASNLAVFGVRGANGVIAVYTKHGETVYREEYYKGIINDKLRGYYLAREFYSPNYETSNIERSDHRATIYWNPEIVSDSTGTAKFSFFTSDDPGFMLLKVEGLSFDGKPGVGFLTIAKTN
jgi:TonB-dependent SusC/RagA subfamily outer membrane receptor